MIPLQPPIVVQLDGNWLAARQRLGGDQASTVREPVADCSLIVFCQWKICFDGQPHSAQSPTSCQAIANQSPTNRTILR